MKILPITALRDTNNIEGVVNESPTPIHISKNGQESMVLMSEDLYEQLTASSSPNFDHVELGGPDPEHHDDPLGFVRVRAASIPIHLSNVAANVEEIKKSLRRCQNDGVKVACFHELSLCGYTCGDLLLDGTVLSACLDGLSELKEFSKGVDVLFAVGLPFEYGHRLYNVAALICQGRVLGLVPKRAIPSYQEFYEKRYFHGYEGPNKMVYLDGEGAIFGNKVIFVDSRYPELRIGVEICEDLWVPSSPSIDLSLAGANLILNLSASNETVGKADYRRDLVRMTSAKLLSAYVYSDAGEGESTTDCVYSSHNLIAENGTILSESELFAFADATADIDIEKLNAERRKTNSLAEGEQFAKAYFSLPLDKPEKALRHYARNPFIPEGEEVDIVRVKEVLAMQVAGLVNRMKAIHCQKAIVGLSGGLDSTLALLVAVEAFKKLGLPLANLTAITLPAFGTSKRTHDNAMNLASQLGVSFREISIKETLCSHLKDIGHAESNHNVAYENAQARERTQVLMDIANDEGSLMIGTGDLSELCLGWCTYGGDHMSMYGVNASIPKTLVRYLCLGYAKMHPEAASSLLDIIDTPISPELLPTKDGVIAQKTEDTVGPYELNDFFIYHFLRFRYRMPKLYCIAKQAYEGVYDSQTIKHWLKRFAVRFYHNQFKRSCLPDGPKVGSVAISPRGDWRMPSDADVSGLEKSIDALE